MAENSTVQSDQKTSTRAARGSTPQEKASATKAKSSVPRSDAAQSDTGTSRSDSATLKTASKTTTKPKTTTDTIPPKATATKPKTTTPPKAGTTDSSQTSGAFSDSAPQISAKNDGKQDGAKDEVVLNQNFHIPSALLKFIPYDSAELYKIVPLDLQDEVLYVGAVNPTDLDARDALNFITSGHGFEYRIQKIDETFFRTLLNQYDSPDLDVEGTLAQIEEGEDDNVLLGIGDDEEGATDTSDIIREEAPTIKLVSNILAQAVVKGVSDIHVEPGEKTAAVRYRIDGVLQDHLRFSKRILDSFVARIKILSNLRIDERRRPQDGRFSSRIRNNPVDFRVAIFPTVNGEKIILRVLDKEKGLRDLTSVGFEESAYKVVLRAIQRPYGLVLATGPTGAGKTTTLYAILNMIDRVNQSIVSLEDPVEYRLDGVNQSNIRPEIGYTFATGLRSVLRTDPDQIFVGEIRDKETAHLAVQAALTGHLVYSTMHTNNAISAVSRLINFGIDPFLLAPTLLLVIGQRMVRRLDGEGREMPITSAMRTHLEKQFEDLPQRYKSMIPDFTAFRDPVPSQESPSGMRGRIGVFEVFEVNEESRSIIFSEPNESKIFDAVRKDGFMTMAEDAIVKSLKGIIPFSEAMKVGNEGALALGDEGEVIQDR